MVIPNRRFHTWKIVVNVVVVELTRDAKKKKKKKKKEEKKIG